MGRRRSSDSLDRPSANRACSRWRGVWPCTLATAALRWSPTLAPRKPNMRSSSSLGTKVWRSSITRSASSSTFVKPRRHSSSSRLRGCTSLVTDCARLSKLGAAPCRGKVWSGEPSCRSAGSLIQRAKISVAGERRGGSGDVDLINRVTSRRFSPVAALTRLTARCAGTSGCASRAACTKAVRTSSSNCAYCMPLEIANWARGASTGRHARSSSESSGLSARLAVALVSGAESTCWRPWGICFACGV